VQSLPLEGSRVVAQASNFLGRDRWHQGLGLLFVVLSAMFVLLRNGGQTTAGAGTGCGRMAAPAQGKAAPPCVR